MANNTHSPAVDTFISWLEQHSDARAVDAARMGADIGLKNDTGSDAGYDNGLYEVAHATETLPALEAKIAQITYSAQWDESLCHTAECFVETEETDDDGNPLRYTENEHDAAQVLFNYAQVWHDAITPN